MSTNYGAWKLQRAYYSVAAVATLFGSCISFRLATVWGVELIGWPAAAGWIFFPYFVFEALDADGVMSRIKSGVHHPDRQSFALHKRLSGYSFFFLWVALSAAAGLCSIVFSKI